MVRYSFIVRLFHPLLHAGFDRRFHLSPFIVRGRLLWGRPEAGTSGRKMEIRRIAHRLAERCKLRISRITRMAATIIIREIGVIRG